MQQERTELKLGTTLLHGGDYNPDQWLEYPEVLEEDIRLMKEAKVNCVSLGIFSWTMLEPEEGRYEFDWLEGIMQKLYENGIYTILATPTGAMPAWLTQAHEEAMQVNEFDVRNFQGNRHNFCPSSPVMRKKMQEIDSKLAQHFGKHPGLIAWHLSNEYGGNGRDASCHCPHCQAAFRTWLQAKYKTLDALNAAWWTKFWSHTYTDWSQIRSASARGENLVHGQNLDWKRFVSDQLLDFCKAERDAVRAYSDAPITTNMMGFFKPLNYFKWARELDFVSWDSYPDWHSGESELPIASDTAAAHDLMRSLKQAPFLLMESTPSMVNWRPNNPLKRPGMHALSSLQAIAHGSNSVQYFQWRKSRGSSEKYHGAVVDHKNGGNTRVFRDVADVGARLETLSATVCGTNNRPKVAMVFDWENWWAVEDACAVRSDLSYVSTLMTYYRPLWDKGIDVDFVDMEMALDGYSVVIAPLNYMYRGDYAQRVRDYVRGGGCYVTTYWSGEVDDTDLCFLGAHPLRDVLGIRTEEIDAPGPYSRNSVELDGKAYRVTGLCGLVHAESAETLAVYQQDFYQGYPAVTRNRFGEGEAYYIASQNEASFLTALYDVILSRAGVACAFSASLPEGVTVSERCSQSGEAKTLWFLQNFNPESAVVTLTGAYRDLESGAVLRGAVELAGFTCKVLEEARAKDEA